MRFWVIGFILMLAGGLCAQDSQDAKRTDTTGFLVLSGPLPSRLVKDTIPYLAIRDVYVTPGSTVIIDPGVVLLFENFTGLHVQGTLLVQGSKKEPVIFSSRNDRTWNETTPVLAAPYDWNGIDIYEDAVGSEFAHCKVMYTVYGIKAQTPYFRITGSQFMHNGKVSLTIKGIRRETGESPYSYAPPGGATMQPVPGTMSANAGNPALRFSLRSSGILLAAAGGGFGGWGVLRLKKSQKAFSEANDSPDPVRFDAKVWDSLKKDRDKDLAYTIAGFSVALLGAVAFSVSFAF